MKLSKEEMEKVRENLEESLEKAKENLAKRRRQADEPPKETRTGVCVACKGKVIGVIVRQYIGDWRHRIIGPGSRSQMTNVHKGFHCESCGLKYEFPPPEKLDHSHDDG